MKKQTLILLSLIVIISGIATTTVYAGGDRGGGGELPPITIPATNVSVNPDATTEEIVPTTEGGEVTTADSGFEVSGVDFTEITDPSVIQPVVTAPKKTRITKLIKGTKRFTVKWKKVKGVKGYQIQYSTKKNFKKKYRKTITVKKAKTVKRTVKKLKSGKRYFVRVRTYKIVNGKKVYSKWSAKKSVKVK